MCFENNLTTLALQVMSYIFLVVNKRIQLKDQTQHWTSACLCLVNIGQKEERRLTPDSSFQLLHSEQSRRSELEVQPFKER